jgi:hypothetical protein
MVGGGLVQFIILEKRIILTKKIGLGVCGLVQYRRQNKYSFEVDSSGGLLLNDNI